MSSAPSTRRQPRKDYSAMGSNDDDSCDDPDDVQCDAEGRCDNNTGNIQTCSSPSNRHMTRMSNACSTAEDMRNFTCVVCFSRTGDAVSHLEHLRSAHSKLRTHCLVCETEYDTYHLYEAHLRQTHAETVERIQSVAKSGGLYCAECGKTFVTESFLHRHRSQHFMLDRETCPTCGKTFVEGPAMERHLKTHEQNQFPCTKCTKTFQDARALKSHVQRHRKYTHLCQGSMVNDV